MVAFHSTAQAQINTITVYETAWADNPQNSQPCQKGVKLEADFLIESKLVTHHSLRERSSGGGFNLKGDQFIELRILESAKSVRIDQITIFQRSITDSEAIKRYELSIIEEDDFIRIIPATANHDKL